jgi:predicted nucleic acid-binding protein
MNDPASPCLVDTNILVYSLVHDDQRWARAEELIAELLELNALRTSTQVLQEFIAVTTRKLKRPLTTRQALVHAERFAVCPVVVNDLTTIREAVRLSEREPISFWDALLVAAAAKARCARLYTEDLQHGRSLLGVQIVNPFLR